MTGLHPGSKFRVEHGKTQADARCKIVCRIPHEICQREISYPERKTHLRPHTKNSFRIFLTEDRGYTSLSMALALLLSFALIFSTAQVSWLFLRSNSAQELADSAALAGENVVGSYATIAQLVDACSLSMGLSSMVGFAAALVLSAIPGASSVAVEVESLAQNLAQARSEFSESAYRGLSYLEQTLGVLAAANATLTITANNTESVSYTGSATLYPQESLSTFPENSDISSLEEIGNLSQLLREASDAAEEAKEQMDEDVYQGWFYDCGSTPHSLYERSSTLAVLSAADNPYYARPEAWNFGAALTRARKYYARRLALEHADASDIESITDSEARRVFYTFAVQELKSGFYLENDNGSVSLKLPRLPKNTQEVRQTQMYTQSLWPCTQEEAGRTLHSSLACPNATGGSSGFASLQDLEQGLVEHCDTCRMDVGDLGKTPLASTAIDNGFEYYWRHICEAAERYEAASEKYAQAQQEIEEVSERSTEAYQDALQSLTQARAHLCPPGAWGCIAVVVRASSTSTPQKLNSVFATSTTLPAGAAVAGAVLAPDNSSTSDNVISRFFDGLLTGQNFGSLGVFAQGLMSLWAQCVQGYAQGYEGIQNGISDILVSVDGVFGTSLSARFQRKLADIVEDLGLEPADIRSRKPVLVATQTILNQAGHSDLGSVRSLIERLPTTTNPQEFAQSFVESLVEMQGDGGFLIAELTIPGTDIKIPLTVDLHTLLGAS